MVKGSRWQWNLIFGLCLGNLVTLGIYLYPQLDNDPKTQAPFLMAALDSVQVEKALAPLSQNFVQNKSYILVPLEQDERALMLQATLDHQQTSKFILDTGATYTTISQDMAKKLGYDLTHAARVRITTANGQVSLPKIVLKSVTLNGYTAHNVEATVMPMPQNVPFSGLLGLSFVKRHRITIDSEAEHLVIEPQQEG